MVKIARCIVTYREEEVPKTLLAFKSWTFTSGPTTGQDFKVFARLFKNFIKRTLPKNAVLTNCKAGHYILSGFVQRGDKFVYFSISDVRYFRNKWFDNILIRTATSAEDYTGGSNSYTTLANFQADVNRLLN